MSDNRPPTPPEPWVVISPKYADIVAAILHEHCETELDALRKHGSDSWVAEQNLKIECHIADLVATSINQQLDELP